MSHCSAMARKSLADVTRRKGRTAMVVLGIFIGVFGLTAINFTEDTIFSAYAYGLGVHADQPDIDLNVDRLDPTLQPLLASAQGVQAVQYHTIFQTLWHVDKAPGYVEMAVDSSPDLEHISIAPFELTAGRYPGVGEIVMDSTGQAVQPIIIGNTIKVDSPQGETQLQMVGLARRPGVAGGDVARGLGYMSDAGLEKLTAGADVTSPVKRQLNHSIMVRISDPAKAQSTAEVLSQILHDHGVTVFIVTLPKATNVPLEQIDGVFTLLRVLVGLAVVMTGLLIVNTVTTLVAEQIAIIGTMKAVGGTRWTIMRGYMISVGLYSSLATLPGLALGLAGGYLLASYLASAIPLDLGPFTVSPWVVALSLMIGYAIPVLAAIVPLWNGTRITVHDALSAYGVAGGHPPQSSDISIQSAKTGSRFSWISQTARMGIRGIFRKPMRLALTLLTLTTAGTCFLVVQTATGSVDYTVGLVYHNVAADVDVRTMGGTPYDQLKAKLAALPNVQRIERYDVNHTTTRWGTLQVLGVDWDTQLYHYTLTSGRWLQAGDTNAVLVSDDLAARSGLHIGDTLTVQSQNGRSVSWTIVGTVQQPVDVFGWVGAAVTSIDALNEFEARASPSGASGVGIQVIVQAKDRSQSAVDDLARFIDTTLNTQVPTTGSGNTNLGPSVGSAGKSDTIARIETWHDYSTRRLRNWSILYILLYGVALVVGAAGIVGLANALAAAVLERRREIGMLRAMGAASWRLAQVFWVEALGLGGLAWVCGALLGLPLAWLFVQTLSRLVLPVEFIVEPVAFLAMLIAIAGISTLATVSPSLQALRIRVSEMLRYE